MANLITFNNVLIQRCGIGQAQARAAFAADGYDGMEAFSTLTDREIEQFVKAVNKLPEVDGEAPKVPHASIIRLKTMRLWTLWQLRQGVDVVHVNYTQAAEAWAAERFRFEAELEVNKPDTPKSPEKFTNFDKGWRPFKDGIMGLLSAVRGGINIPLGYVLRDHLEVTPEVRNAQYATSDDMLMAVVQVGPDSAAYKADNARVWNLIQPLLAGTNAWEHVKQFDKSKNARGAWKVLLRYGEGDAQMDTKYANAKKKLNTLEYTGTSRKFSVSSYLKALQSIFNDFEDCGKPYDDFEKVVAFVDGLKVKDLNPIKIKLITELPYKNNYEEAIGCFNMSLNHTILDIAEGGIGQERNVSTVDTKSEWLPPDEWKKLSKEEKKQRNIARAKAKAKKDGNVSVGAVSTKAQKRQAKKKRKLMRLAQEVIKEAEEGEESDAKKQRATSQASSSPADQFGRHSSAVKLARMLAGQANNDSD